MSEESPKICGIEQNTFVKWTNGIVGALMVILGIANTITFGFTLD